MYYMVYLKDDTRDSHFKVINPKTSCYIDKLMYAPRFIDGQLDELKKWIDTVHENSKTLHLQIRVAGTQNVIYG